MLLSQKLSDAPSVNVVSQDEAMRRQLGEKAKPVTETQAPGVAVTLCQG
jgi:hypothetical protein